MSRFTKNPLCSDVTARAGLLPFLAYSRGLASLVGSCCAPAMEREFGRDGATLASASPSIVSWDPLAGELLRGHLEAEGFPSTVVLADHDFAESSAPLVVLPPPSYAEYLGGAWDSRLRGVPLDVPIVVLARPTVPVRSALQLNLRKSGVALLDTSRASTVAAVPSALRMSLEGGQVTRPAVSCAVYRQLGDHAAEPVKNLMSDGCR